MSEKLVNLADYSKKNNQQKKLKSEKSYEEILSEKYAEDLASEFKKNLYEEKSSKK